MYSGIVFSMAEMFPIILVLDPYKEVLVTLVKFSGTTVPPRWTVKCSGKCEHILKTTVLEKTKTRKTPRSRYF